MCASEFSLSLSLSLPLPLPLPLSPEFFTLKLSQDKGLPTPMSHLVTHAYAHTHTHALAHTHTRTRTYARTHTNAHTHCSTCHVCTYYLCSMIINSLPTRTHIGRLCAFKSRLLVSTAALCFNFINQPNPR